MNWKLSLVKALKAFAYTALGCLIVTFLSPDFQLGLNAFADQVSAAVPYVGPLAGPVIKGALLSGAAGSIHWLQNVYKHWNDEK